MLKLVRRLFEPVDIASIVFFRIAFGLIILWEVWMYFDYGWVEKHFIDPAYHFTYYGFDWIKPWPGDGMYVHFGVLGVLATFVSLGFLYRVSTALLFICFTYVFLLDEALYLNHFYLICLISFLMIFIPANRAFSIDGLIRPKIHSESAPAWALWILRFQIGIPYFFGGFAKLNGDWLRGEPMAGWLAARTAFPIIGQWFTETWMVYIFSYGGLLLDLFLVPLLLWKRTRFFAFCAAVLFHLTNARLFDIGIFPWFMIAATLIFFSPDWPRAVLRTFWPYAIGGPDTEHGKLSVLNSRQIVTLVLLGVYVTIQVLIPFRHYLYPGNVHWTEEGQRISWFMMLRFKSSRIKFIATDPKTKESWVVDPRKYLTSLQIGRISSQPDRIHQFCQHLSKELQRQGYEKIEIRALVMSSLNVRRPQLLIDPEVNLAVEKRSLLPSKWILPLKEPLPKNRKRIINR